MFSSFRMNLRVIGFLSLVIGVSAVACDTIPLFAPTSATITLSAPKRALALGETVTLTAVVVKQANTTVQNGTLVTFVTTLGSVTPAQVETVDGVATATFSAGSTSGTATVTATSGTVGASTGSSGNSGTGGGSTTTTAANVIQFTIGAANAAGVIVTASPTTVPSTGGSSQITALVRDSLGSPLKGVPVAFSTTAGTLSATSALTDTTTGQATVTLTTAVSAVVTATAGSSSSGTTTTPLTATVNVTVATPATLALAVAPSSPVAGQPVTLTITPTITTGNPAPQVSVDWGDGSTVQLGTVGAAVVTSHTYNAPGSYTITVHGTALGETTTSSTGVAVGASSVTVTAAAMAGNTKGFTFTITPVATANPTDVKIDFGDGSAPLDLGAITTPTTVNRIYGAAGQYTVKVTQTNANGTTSTAVVVVTAT
jgi:adhesin/invasin